MHQIELEEFIKQHSEEYIALFRDIATQSGYHGFCLASLATGDILITSDILEDRDILHIIHRSLEVIQVRTPTPAILNVEEDLGGNFVYGKPFQVHPTTNYLVLFVCMPHKVTSYAQVLKNLIDRLTAYY